MHSERSIRYYGWAVVALSFVVLTAAYALLYCYSVFVPYLAEDLGLSRAAVSAPFSFCVIAYSVTSLLSGRLTDRLGPRLVVLTGGALMVAGYCVLGIAEAPWQLYLGYSVLYGLGMSGAYIPTSATLVRWFSEKRGLALATANLGGSVAMAAGPALGAAAILSLGWRDAFVAVGVLCGGLVMLAALGLRRDPGESPTVAASSIVETEPSFTLRQARRTTAFWMLCAIFLLTWSVMFFPFAHFIALAVDLGWGPEAGVAFFAIAGIGGAAGRLGIGWISDKVGRKAGLITFLTSAACACFLFATSTEPAVLYIAAVLFGIGGGASVALYPAVVGDIFGRAHVGAIAGFAFAFTCSGGALGPMIGGWIRDVSGSYDDAFLLGAAVNVLAIGFALALNRPQAR